MIQVIRFWCRFRSRIFFFFFFLKDFLKKCRSRMSFFWTVLLLSHELIQPESCDWLPGCVIWSLVISINKSNRFERLCRLGMPSAFYFWNGNFSGFQSEVKESAAEFQCSLVPYVSVRAGPDSVDKLLKANSFFGPPYLKSLKCGKQKNYLNATLLLYSFI